MEYGDLEILNRSQSPDGDFFDPECDYFGLPFKTGFGSQSPDGDFFDPEWLG